MDIECGKIVEQMCAHHDIVSLPRHRNVKSFTSLIYSPLQFPLGILRHRRFAQRSGLLPNS